MFCPQNYWYIASYPKSGNTWCRIFIANVLNQLTKNDSHKKFFDLQFKDFNLNKDLQNVGQIVSSRYWIDDQLGIDTSDLELDEIKNIRNKVGESLPIFHETYRFHKIHDSFNLDKTSNVPIVSTKNCLGAIYLVRNPFDIVISLSKFFDWSYERTIKFMCDDNASLFNLDDIYLNQVPQFLGSWDYHVKSWLNQKKIPIYLIKYEDLLDNPEYFFLNLASFLNLTSDKELVNKAIIESEFKKIQDAEIRLVNFQEKPTQCKQFFRSGKKGEGLKFLNQEQINKMENNFNAVINQLGYELS